MTENPFRSQIEVIFSLVQHQNRDKVSELEWTHLVFINLNVFDGDELVADVMIKK